MDKKEVVKICLNYLNEGANIDEVIELVKENSCFNVNEIINSVYKLQATGGK